MRIIIFLGYYVLSFTGSSLGQTINAGAINVLHEENGTIWCNVTGGLPITSWINETGSAMTEGCVVDDSHKGYIIPHTACDSSLGYFIFNVTFDRLRDCQNWTCFNIGGFWKTLEITPVDFGISANTKLDVDWDFTNWRDFNGTCTTSDWAFPLKEVDFMITDENKLSDITYHNWTEYDPTEPDDSQCRLRRAVASIAGTSNNGDFQVVCSAGGLTSSSPTINAPLTLAAFCGTLILVLVIIACIVIAVVCVVVKKRGKTSKECQPDPPTGLSCVTSNDGKTKFSWEKASNNRGGQITKYYLKIQIKNKKWETFKDLTTSMLYENVKLKSGTYRASVQAENQGGLSGYCDPCAQFMITCESSDSEEKGTSM